MKTSEDCSLSYSDDNNSAPEVAASRPSDESPSALPQCSSSDKNIDQQPVFACPPPKDVQHVDQVDWGPIQPKVMRQDLCGCLPSVNNTLCCQDESCILFACQEECGPKCMAGNLCGNKRIRNRQWKKVQVFDAGSKKGRGLRTLEPIRKGDFIIEYVGKAVRKKDLESLFTDYYSERMLYIMSLDGDIYIDARKTGGLARYLNHSCQPNCKLDRWKVFGVSRAVVFATRDILAGEELTFDYKWIRRRGRAPTKCYCLAPLCRGTLELTISKVESDLNVNLEGRWIVPRSYNAGEELVNRMVKVFVEGSQEYLVASVRRYDSVSCEHLLVYRYDGKECWEHLGRKTWLILDEEGEKFEIKRKQRASPRISSPSDLNSYLADAAAPDEPFVLVTTQVKQSLIDNGVILTCENDNRVHIHASKFSRSSFLAENCNELSEEVKVIFDSSRDSLLWKLSISGLNISRAVEFLKDKVEAMKQNLEQQQITSSSALKVDEVKMHTLIFPREIADIWKQRLPQFQAKNRTVEFTVIENVSRTVEMFQLKGNNPDDLQNATLYLWNEMKTICAACKLPRSGGQEFKHLGFRAGSIDEANLRHLLSIEDDDDVDQCLKDAPFFRAVESTLECTIWIQTEDDIIKSCSLLKTRDIYIGCFPSKVEIVWNSIQIRLANLNQGVRYLNAPEVVGFCQSLLSSSLSNISSSGGAFLDYVERMTGVQVSIDHHITRGWVELCYISTQAESKVNIHENVLFAEKLLYLQISILRNRFVRQNQWIFGRNWAFASACFSQKLGSHNADADTITVAKGSSLNEPGIHFTLCVEIAELTESASLSPSVAAHAVIILYRYLCLISRLAEYPSLKPRDVGLACLFIANKCQKCIKWKRLDSLIEDIVAHFYPELKFDISSDAALDLESRIIAAEQSIIETLFFDVSWDGMSWILRTVLQLKISEPLAMNAFRMATTASVLAAGPKVWLTFGPQYVFAALLGLLSVDIFPLIDTLGLKPQKLAETAEQIVSVMKKLSMFDENQGPPKKKRKGRVEELSLGLRSLLYAGLPRVVETCTKILRDTVLPSFRINFEQALNYDLTCVIEGINKSAMIKVILPSLKNLLQLSGCNFFVDKDTEDTCKIILLGGCRSLAVAEHAVLEFLCLNNVSHSEVTRPPADSYNKDHDAALAGWLNSCSEGNAVVLNLKNFCLSDLSSYSKNFLSCSILADKLPSSGLGWWISTNSESSSGFLQDFILVQNALASDTAHHRVIQGIAYPTSNSTYEGPKLRNAPAISSSPCFQLLASKENFVPVSLKRWPSDKAEAKQIKSADVSKMSLGFSPAALQEIQLLREFHAQVDSPRGHPNIILPIAVAASAARRESPVVPESLDLSISTVESNSFDAMHVAPKSNFATLPKSIEEVGSHNSYLVFEPISLFLQQILSRRKSNKNFKKGNDIVTPVLFASWFYDLLSTLAHCHSNQTVLKVLKPDQIYLDNAGVVKLGELGGSMVLPFKHADESGNEFNLFKNAKQSRREEDEVLGDPYQAPELLLGSKAYSKESDIWSLGALMATLLLGKPLFSGKDRHSLLISIFKVSGTPSSSNFPSAKKSPHFKNLKDTMSKSKSYKHQIAKAMSKMLDDECLVREYSGALQLLDKILHLDPKLRISAADALKEKYMQDYAVSFRSFHNSRIQYAIDWRNLRRQLTLPNPGSTLMDTTIATVCVPPKVDLIAVPSRCEGIEHMDDDLYGDIQPQEWER
jgi:serine/threonine protein kinase